MIITKKSRAFALATGIFLIIVTSDISAGEIDQEFRTTDNPYNATMVGIVTTSLAQTFTVGVTGTFDTVEFKVIKYPETTGNLTFDIRHASVAGQTQFDFDTPDPFFSNTLFTATILNADIGASFPWSSITVDLSSARIEAKEGDMFALVLTSTLGQAFAVQTDYLNGYSYGERCSQIEDGSFFSPHDYADLTFKTTMNVNVPEPNSISLPALGLLLMTKTSKDGK